MFYLDVVETLYNLLCQLLLLKIKIYLLCTLKIKVYKLQIVFMVLDNHNLSLESYSLIIILFRDLFLILFFFLMKQSPERKNVNFIESFLLLTNTRFPSLQGPLLHNISPRSLPFDSFQSVSVETNKFFMSKLMKTTCGRLQHKIFSPSLVLDIQLVLFLSTFYEKTNYPGPGHI